MSLEQIKVGCDHCGSSFVATPTRTFLGFQRITCPNCRAKIIYPLTSGFRVTYWVIAILMLLYAINAFMSGGYAYPGGIGLAVLFAIYRDRTLRKRIGTTDFSSAPNHPSERAQKAMRAPDYQATIDEDRVYCQIAEELETGPIDKGLWTHSFAECGGDEKQTKVLYIKRRAQRIVAAERVRLAQETRHRVAEVERIETSNVVPTSVGSSKNREDAPSGSLAMDRSRTELPPTTQENQIGLVAATDAGRSAVTQPRNSITATTDDRAAASDDLASLIRAYVGERQNMKRDKYARQRAVGLCGRIIDAADGEVRRTSALGGMRGIEVGEVVIGDLRTVYVTDEQLLDWIDSALLPRLNAQGINSPRKGPR